MRHFKDLTAAEQTDIALRFVLPSDTSEVQVDEHNRPFIQDGGRMMCTVKNDNFHVHQNKGRLREQQ